MPGVFISHSSKDKEFAFRLAIDLMNLGFPVWFDAYELGIGSSLRRRIHDGIDTSTHLVLLVSDFSVTSKWVQEELELALEKEKELNYPFILPVRLDDCVVPLSIRGRLYATFSDGYLKALEQLEVELRKRGADRIELPFEKRLVPLRLEHGLFVNEIALSKRIKQITAGARNVFQPAQIVVSPDPIYDSLRVKLLKTIEEAEKNRETPRDELRYLREVYEGVKLLEEKLPKAVAEALNHVLRRGATLIDPAVVVSWIVRIIRNELLSVLWRSQKRTSDIIPINQDVKHSLFRSDAETAEFYGVEKIFRYVVFRNRTDETTSVLTAFDHRISQEIENHKGFLSYSIPLLEAEISTIEQFILPQIFYRGWFKEGWTIEECQVRYP